ncbi:hypothetical protein [Parabacteroides sp.]
MKKTYLMLLLALAGFGSSCTNDDDTTEIPVGAANEIQLVFSGSGESEEYTKAIASDSENQIENLKVYLFAAASANAADADYEYMETWTKTNATPGDKQFLLQSSGSSWKASIKPGELKGLPYLTLVCVANQDNLFAADGNPFAALTAVTTDTDGAIAMNGTSLADFKAAYTAKLAADGIIKTPLAMTGTNTTKISGSVSKVAITLKRVMARFDIDNTTATSRLTIKSVALGQGRPNGSLFGATPGAITGAPAESADLMTYTDVPFTGENANQGTLESAIYVYPNLATDQSYLIIKGAYSSTLTNQPVDVTYNIPIVKTPAEAKPGDPANYIAINANSRYKLRITDVTESNIFSTFEVEDWTSGGGVIIKPENAKPEVKELTGDNVPTLLPGMDTFYRTDENGTFNIVINSSGELEYSRALLTKVEEIDWLTVGDATSEQVDGLTVTTYPITIADAAGKRPVSLTFINKAASYDPDLQTTLTFVGPAAAPVPSVVDKGNSDGNEVDVTSLDAPTATMVKANGSYVSLNVFCVDGLDVTLSDETGYSAKAVATEGFTTTYRIDIIDAKNAKDAATVEFKNKVADTNKITLTLNHKKASQPTIAANDQTGTYAKSDYNDETLGGSGSAATANMFLVDGSTIYVKATCTESQEAGAVKAESANSNLTVSETATPGIFEIKIPTASLLTAGNVVVTFKNATDEAVTSTLTITAKSAVPTVDLTADGNNAITDNNNGSYTVDMTTLDSETFTLTVEAPLGASLASLTTPFEGDKAWLQIDGSPETTISSNGSVAYTFKKGTDDTKSAPITLTFTNAVTGGGDLTITLSKN